jgi:Flp pilus assembly protein TadB
LVIASGLMIGLGAWLVVRRLAPVHANLVQALAGLSATIELTTTEPQIQGWETVGAWGLAKLPPTLAPIPRKDLALLEMTPTAMMARKLAFCLAGLLVPGLVSLVLLVIGLHLPIAVPGIATLACAAGGFLLPDILIRSQAARLRTEWMRTLACFIDLVALERSCGSGATQALDVAADIGDSRVFQRLRESLDHSQWAGVAAWDGLRRLADDIDLPALADVADIIRLSATEGSGVYKTLRAKARGLRESILITQQTQANETNEKMSLPVSVLGIIFLAILIGPALLTMSVSLT